MKKIVASDSVMITVSVSRNATLYTAMSDHRVLGRVLLFLNSKEFAALDQTSRRMHALLSEPFPKKIKPIMSLPAQFRRPPLLNQLLEDVHFAQNASRLQHISAQLDHVVARDRASQNSFGPILAVVLTTSALLSLIVGIVLTIVSAVDNNSDIGNDAVSCFIVSLATCAPGICLSVCSKAKSDDIAGEGRRLLAERKRGYGTIVAQARRTGNIAGVPLIAHFNAQPAAGYSFREPDPAPSSNKPFRVPI